MEEMDVTPPSALDTPKAKRKPDPMTTYIGHWKEDPETAAERFEVLAVLDGGAPSIKKLHETIAALGPGTYEILKGRTTAITLQVKQQNAFII